MTDNVVHVLLPKFIRHEKEDESGVSSCDLLGSDAGTVHPDDLHVDIYYRYIDPDTCRTSREPGQGNVTPSRPQAPSRNYVL